MNRGYDVAQASVEIGGFVEGDNSVGRSVEQLEKSVAVLTDLVGSMDSRLEMVSRPVPSHPVNPDPGTPSDVSSPLVGTLGNVTRRVDGLASRVRAMLDRLELP